VEVPALPFDRALWQAPQRRARAAAGLTVRLRPHGAEREGRVRWPGCCRRFHELPSGN